MTDLSSRIKAVSASPMKTIVKARNFEIIIDEPQEMGGTDEGASPVEYLIAAFSGCINVVAHLVAKEMNFELRGVEIDIYGDLNPAKLFGQSNEERAGFKQINLSIKADTDADEATLEKWLEAIESRCPISDNLQNPTPVKISYKKK
ncbi:MAG TPA: OsmC family protein [Bacteroidales bacterium]|nr:OsmC family protein [Bacteroidales bacterium]